MPAMPCFDRIVVGVNFRDPKSTHLREEGRKETPSESGKPAGDKSRAIRIAFVVQIHLARRIHLQLGGTQAIPTFKYRAEKKSLQILLSRTQA